ncbi:MAG: hypothetical protein F7B11_01930 [Caldisphaeraceae archaeon]|nr:hypothetical protein [Caldisphaeraceae archaeon]
MGKDIKIMKTEQGTYKIEVLGEDHTLGNLLASTLLGLDGVNIAYYEVPHPLENKVFLYIDLEEGIDPIKKLKEALEKIKLMNSKFRQIYLSELKEMGIDVEQ